MDLVYLNKLFVVSTSINDSCGDIGELGSQSELNEIQSSDF